MRQTGQDFTTLRVLYDNCAGQNKKHMIVLIALKLVQASLLFRVEFFFMVSVRSYLPCDRAFGNIEKTLATYTSLTSPVMYKEAIATAIGKRNPVISIELSDFLDARLLLYHKPNVKHQVSPRPLKLLLTVHTVNGACLRRRMILPMTRQALRKSGLCRGGRSIAPRTST